MIDARVYKAPRLGCAECGYYTEDMQLVQVVLAARGTVVCQGCASKLKDKLGYILVELRKEKEAQA